MNEICREAYLNLIDQLLYCPSGEEAEILDVNSELVDTGLVQMMEEVAEYIGVEGNQNGSEFLYNLASIVSDMVRPEDSQNQAYYHFIDAIFSTSSESYIELLKAHQHLIDEQLVVLLLEEATFQEAEGYEGSGNMLRRIASQLNGVFNTNLHTSREEKIACFLLWMELYQTVIDTNGDEQAAYQVLEANSDQLNNEFAAQINCWIEIIFPDLTLEEVEATINVLLGINNWLSELPIGNKDINLEIAIASYESLLPFVEPDTLPETWATLNNHLGCDYYHRREGEQADNLAKAIDCYQLGLQVCSPDKFSQIWGLLQANLGNAYLDSNNLEAAVTAFQASLQSYTDTEYPVRWAGTHNRLGLIYANIQQYQSAITAHNIALNIFNRDNYPEEWAATHSYLGQVYYKRIDGEKLDNLEAAIEHYLAALQIYTKEKSPLDWAKIQNHLGDVYCERIAGEKSENLEQAHCYYLAAFEVYIKADLPIEVAMTKFNLGRLYLDRIQGIEPENVKAAITCFEAALQVFTREAFPELWGCIQMSLNSADIKSHGEQESVELVVSRCQAALEIIYKATLPELWAANHNLLGISYLHRIHGEKADNIEAAIRHLSTALEVYTRQDFTSEWATVQKLLGNAYFERIRGEKSQNIEAAIQYYLTALEVHNCEAFADNWASIQNSLGSAYCNRIEGERADNLETAINYYRTALQIYTCHTNSDNWAMTQCNLATAYFNRIRGEKADNLEAAISYYQAALTIYTHEVFPERWATTQQQLGNAYTERIRGEKADNLEQAIRCMKSALSVRIRQIFPEDWATTQTNLAGAYTLRIQGEKADNLETAISYSQAALQVYTRESFPEQWAGVHNNLSSVHIERIRGERAENLEQAIRHIQQALKVYTRESFPEQWAMLQTNLGFAYTHRIRGVRVSNLFVSIRNYTNASQVYTRDGNPEKWATTQLNLSGSYFELVRIGENKANNAEKGINCLQNALEVYTREAFPERWAMLQTNLSSASLWLSTIQLQPQAGQDYLESAVSHSHAALQIFTREKFPGKWAIIQQQLGTLHLMPIHFSTEESKWKEELEIAKRHFQASLQIHTKQAFLQNYVQSKFSLATAYKYNREFHKSYETFSTAIDAVEDLRLEITSGEEIKQKLAEQWHVFYQFMVEVCLEIGATEPEFYQKAIEYVERSKARNLVELLYKRDLTPKGDISPTIINKLKQLQRRIVSEQRRLQIEEQKHDNNVFFVSNRTYLNQLLNQSDELISKEIDPIDPTFKATQKVNPIPFEEIQKLLDNRTAIIQWYICSTGLETFIITRHNLQRLILPTPADTLRALEDWERAYREAYNQQKDQWRDGLADRLQRLSRSAQKNRTMLR
jgi:tetratricopeptide (TPR) repeat protein